MGAARTYTGTQVVIAAATAAIGVGLLTYLAIKLAPATSGSPIKVNGGAMTFWTKKGVTFDTASNGYCVPLGTSGTVQMKLFQPDNYTSTPDQHVTLSSTAQIDLFGFKGTGFAPSNNGVRVLISGSCGSSNGPSALVQPEDGGNSGFYQNMKNAAAPSNRHFVRFQDLSCPSPPSPSADEDSCEHLDRIYVSSTPTSSPPTGAPWGKCDDGQCRLEIGP